MGILNYDSGVTNHEFYQTAKEYNEYMNALNMAIKGRFIISSITNSLLQSITTASIEAIY